LALYNKPMERPMPHRFDATRSLTILEQDSTIIAVIEMSNRSGSFRRSFPALNAPAP
jgi:hypothetical protein